MRMSGVRVLTITLLSTVMLGNLPVPFEPKLAQMSLRRLAVHPWAVKPMSFDENLAYLEKEGLHDIARDRLADRYRDKQQIAILKQWLELDSAWYKRLQSEGGPATQISRFVPKEVKLTAREWFDKIPTLVAVMDGPTHGPTPWVLPDTIIKELERREHINREEANLLPVTDIKIAKTKLAQYDSLKASQVRFQDIVKAALRQDEADVKDLVAIHNNTKSFPPI